MNNATTLTAPRVWHISFDGIKKNISRTAASLSRLPWGGMLALVAALAVVIAFSGILNLEYFQELFSGLLNGSLQDSGFFRSLPLRY